MLQKKDMGQEGFRSIITLVSLIYTHERACSDRNASSHGIIADSANNEEKCRERIQEKEEKKKWKRRR